MLRPDPSCPRSPCVAPEDVVAHARALLPFCLSIEEGMADRDELDLANDRPSEDAVYRKACDRALRLASIFAGRASKFLADFAGYET